MKCCCEVRGVVEGDEAGAAMWTPPVHVRDDSHRSRVVHSAELPNAFHQLRVRRVGHVAHPDLPPFHSGIKGIHAHAHTHQHQYNSFMGLCDPPAPSHGCTHTDRHTFAYQLASIHYTHALTVTQSQMPLSAQTLALSHARTNAD
eukprot:GHVU01138835.1.p4 GENE.GHVU01138835.1~~GHVU01138835.1.p4  ORF type:complete len:145 (-),score=4.61 GHVU01138835.1:1620-2054(-)